MATGEVIDALAQMLTSPRVELQEPARAWTEQQRAEQEAAAKQQVTLAGLGAVKTLFEQNDSADLRALVAVVDRLVASPDTPPRIKVQATIVQQAIGGRR
jgi:hypothetical protein